MRRLKRCSCWTKHLQLAGIDERKETIVECRYFIGLTLAEVAELLGVGQSTVEREWRFARSWLKREMTGSLHISSAWRRRWVAMSRWASWSWSESMSRNR